MGENADGGASDSDSGASDSDSDPPSEEDAAPDADPSPDEASDSPGADTDDSGAAAPGDGDSGDATDGSTASGESPDESADGEGGAPPDGDDAGSSDEDDAGQDAAVSGVDTETDLFPEGEDSIPYASPDDTVGAHVPGADADEENAETETESADADEESADADDGGAVQGPDIEAPDDPRPDPIHRAAKAGAGTEAEAGAGAEVGTTTGGAARQGPTHDEEMPLAEHVEEMINRMAIVAFVAAGVAVLAFPFGEAVINFLWGSVLPASDTTRPHLYSPLELVITQLKVASLAGLVIALPVLVYQTYRFMRPGLYPRERRYYLAAVPTSLVLAFVGLVFAYYVVLPAVFTYFFNYTEGTAEVAFALGQTFNLILILMGYLAIVFQIPLFVMLALMMGLVSRRWLVQRRLLFWGAFLGISFLFSPDPTGVSPFIIAVTMAALFEGTLVLARWTKTG